MVAGRSRVECAQRCAFDHSSIPAPTPFHNLCMGLADEIRTKQNAEAAAAANRSVRREAGYYAGKKIVDRVVPEYAEALKELGVKHYCSVGLFGSGWRANFGSQ